MSVVGDVVRAALIELIRKEAETAQRMCIAMVSTHAKAPAEFASLLAKGRPVVKDGYELFVVPESADQARSVVGRQLERHERIAFIFEASQVDHQVFDITAFRAKLPKPPSFN